MEKEMIQRIGDMLRSDDHELIELGSAILMQSDISTDDYKLINQIFEDGYLPSRRRLNIVVEKSMVDYHFTGDPKIEDLNVDVNIF